MTVEQNIRTLEEWIEECDRERERLRELRAGAERTMGECDEKLAAIDSRSSDLRETVGLLKRGGSDVW